MRYQINNTNLLYSYLSGISIIRKPYSQKNAVLYGFLKAIFKIFLFFSGQSQHFFKALTHLFMLLLINTVRKYISIMTDDAAASSARDTVIRFLPIRYSDIALTVCSMSNEKVAIKIDVIKNAAHNA